MRISAACAALALGFLSSVDAHGHVTGIFIDDEPLPRGTCLRLSNVPHKGSPLEDLSSSDLICGRGGLTPADRTCPVKAGSKLSFEWILYGPNPQHPKETYFSPGHPGPFSVYMKRLDSPRDSAEGDGWFKIVYSGFDPATKKWPTERVNADGVLSFEIPENLLGGYYLVRSELVALHSTGAPQFYANCAQIFLESAGTDTPPDTVSIPGESYVTLDHPAMQYNVHDKKLDHTRYPTWGPKLYDSSTSPHASSPFTETQTEGLKPEDCVLEVGNWCGIEASRYTDREGCSKAGQSCWDQTKGYYAQAPAWVGNSMCQIWQNKCKGINEACKTKNFDGPPDAGKDLTPPPEKLTLPAPEKSTETNATSSDQASSAASSRTKAPGSKSSSPRSGNHSMPASSGTASSSDGESYATNAGTNYNTTVPAYSYVSAEPTGFSSSSCAPITETVTMTVTATAGGEMPNYYRRRNVYRR